MKFKTYLNEQFCPLDSAFGEMPVSVASAIQSKGFLYGKWGFGEGEI